MILCTKSPVSPSPTTPILRKSHSTTSLFNDIRVSDNTLSTRISFAPLPPTEPRKRRSSSHIKLGVASRSGMMRQRRSALTQLQNLSNGEPVQPSVTGVTEAEGSKPKPKDRPMPSAGDMWQDQARVYSKAKAQTRKDVPGRDLPEDPLVTMGRLMKSAWRRVSQTSAASQKGSALSHLGGGSKEAQCAKVNSRVNGEKVDRSPIRRRHSHEDGVKPLLLPPVDEELEGGAHANNEEIRHSGNGSIPKPIRRASEPVTSLGSDGDRRTSGSEQGHS